MQDKAKKKKKKKGEEDDELLSDAESEDSDAAGKGHACMPSLCCCSANGALPLQRVVAQQAWAAATSYLHAVYACAARTAGSQVVTKPLPCPAAADDFLAGEEEGGDDGIGADPGAHAEGCAARPPRQRALGSCPVASWDRPETCCASIRGQAVRCLSARAPVAPCAPRAARAAPPHCADAPALASPLGVAVCADRSGMDYDYADLAAAMDSDDDSAGAASGSDAEGTGDDDDEGGDEEEGGSDEELEGATFSDMSDDDEEGGSEGQAAASEEEGGMSSGSEDGGLAGDSFSDEEDDSSDGEFEAALAAEEGLSGGAGAAGGGRGRRSRTCAQGWGRVIRGLAEQGWRAGAWPWGCRLPGCLPACLEQRGGLAGALRLALPARPGRLHDAVVACSDLTPRRSLFHLSMACRRGGGGGQQQRGRCGGRC